MIAVETPVIGGGQARYVEAAVSGVLIGCLYAPNGNPDPGPVFEYKLRWLDRLHAHAEDLLAAGVPVVLVGTTTSSRTISTSTRRSGGGTTRCSGLR